MSLVVPNERGVSNERGATLVEHAIALPLFLLFLIISCDLMRVSYNALTLQFVVERTMREASLGTMTANNILQEVTTRANKLGVPLSNSDISLCPANVASSSCSGVTTGSSNELMALRALVPTRGFLLGEKGFQLLSTNFSLRAMALGRYEPA